MIASAQYTVTTTAVKVSAASQTPKRVHLHVSSGTMFAGPAGVSNATGLLLDKAAGVVTIQIDAADELWVLANGGSHVLTVLEMFL